MRLGLTQLNMRRLYLLPPDPKIRQALRDGQQRALLNKLRGFDQLAYCYYFPLTAGVIRTRVSCSAGKKMRGEWPKLP
jgi:hypothetical protein